MVRIGLDYDGVLADTQGFVVELMREAYDVDIARENFTWDGRPTIDASLDVETDGSFEEFAATPEYVAELDPLPGVRDALRRLAAEPEVELYLATHRPPDVHDAIDRWLERNDLPRLARPEAVPDEKARTTPALDVLVDDYHGHADAASRRGLLGVHLTAAWESGKPAHDRTVRASTWADVVAAIVD
jgi:uncharacterized HAD superfamily protein